MKKHDLAKERPPRELLAGLIGTHGLEAVMNSRSPAFKARGLDLSSLETEAAIDLMLEEPNLIRRPLVISRKSVVFGHRPEEYDEL